jgi:hypothetical protein
MWCVRMSLLTSFHLPPIDFILSVGLQSDLRMDVNGALRRLDRQEEALATLPATLLPPPVSPVVDPSVSTALSSLQQRLSDQGWI